jgi:prevent-host-death family protein
MSTPDTIGDMTSKPAEERSVRDLRADLADVLNAAGVRDQITYVTSRGRRIAAVVPVQVAEDADSDGQAAEDALKAHMYGINVVLLEDRGGIPGRTMEDVFEDYAGSLLDDLGGSAERVMAAARAMAFESAGDVGYPVRFRQAVRTVELCQQAAITAGAVLPGSDVRPEKTASSWRPARRS